MPPPPSATYERLRQHHRQADAHEPHRPTADAHGTAGPLICQATASPAPAQDVARRILGSGWWAGAHLQRHHRLRQRRLQPDQPLGEVQGSPMRPGPLRVLRGARAPAGPGGGTHHPQKPGQLRRHQQSAGALLPLQCRQAMAIVGLRVAPAGIDSAGWNLMPNVHSFGLDFKHAIDQVRASPGFQDKSVRVTP